MVVLANRMLKKAQQRAREQGREEGRREAIEEGIEFANNRWIAWNHRRSHAEANGLPFDEPPPA